MKTIKNILYCVAICCAFSAISTQAMHNNGVPKSEFLEEESNGWSHDDDRGKRGHVRYHGEGRGPVDHYQTAGDRKITSRIRNAIHDDPSLNQVYDRVSITTVHGTVTLKGRVFNEREEEAILEKAMEQVDGRRIKNQLTVSNR